MVVDRSSRGHENFNTDFRDLIRDSLRRLLRGWETRHAMGGSRGYETHFSSFMISKGDSLCRLLQTFVVLTLLSGVICIAATSFPDRPNVVIIFVDDMGYGDIGAFGSTVKTPNLNRLAKEGTRFTDFYVAQAVCSASRAALLTGCYPNRIGILGALSPKSKIGISSNEVTIAQMLKTRGYATAIFGKWHLGDAPQFLPTHHGFDEYFGLPYSNDMWPKHPVNPTNYAPLPLIEGDEVIQRMPDQTQLTTWYTERAQDFIRRNKQRPFFLYLAHNMPHVPLHVSDKFFRRSGHGLYGDVTMELDWSVGEVIKTLRETGHDRDTLVIFTSDNGPWLTYGNHAGTAGPLREGKATSFDGGVREPFIAWWPGKIPAGQTCRELAASIDIFPTVAELCGAKISRDRTIDGKNIWPLLSGVKNAKSPHDAYFIYWGKALHAVRSGKWKLHLPHTYLTIVTPGADGMPGKTKEPKLDLQLFDLEKDVGEQHNVAAQFPDVVERMKNLAEQCREDLGDGARIGRNVRESGKL